MQISHNIVSMTDADDMAARSKRLAKDLLDALDDPDNPERAAYEVEKEAADRAALQAFYVRTGQAPAQSTAPGTAIERVLAEPGSTAARRALAVEWKAAGNPQAELIDNQLAYRELEQANKTSSPAAKALLAAIDRLIKEHGPTWAAPIAKLVDSYKYRRGLVAQVRLSGERFLQVAPELFALAPIQHVNLEAPLALAHVLASPFVGRLASLAIEQQYGGFADREAIALAGSRHVSGLRWLSLYANGIGEAGVEALAASPYLEHCVYLGLVDNPCDPTPSVLDYDGQASVSRPPIAEALERTYGKRPWLTGPAHAEPWPPDRDDLAVTP